MRRIRSVVALLMCVMVCHCAPAPVATSRAAAGAKTGDSLPGATARGAAKIQGVNLNDPIRPAVDDNLIAVGCAKNEWASFSLQISNVPKAARKAIYSLRIQAPRSEKSKDTLEPDYFSAAQILPMPVDVNRAGFVRHTGLSAGNRPLPRALLPVAMDRGVVNLSTARDTGEPLLFWIDLRVPPETPAGEYVTNCELLSSDSPLPMASVPLKITIYDFVLPDDRHLLMTARLGWDDLARLYPEQFETVRPRLLTRADETYAAPIKTLDALIKLAQRHRTEVTIPRLQPTVKWVGQQPQLDWSDLDTVLAPWLSGDAFSDRVPINHWPLPAPDQLDRYDRASQIQYWTSAASHFAQKEWLSHSPVVLDTPVPGRVGGVQSIQLSADAGEILRSHPQVRVTLPLEEDQIQLGGQENVQFIDPKTTSRLLAVAPGIVFNTPIQRWPANVKRPQYWLRTDIPGLVPYVGAGGDERDVRVWAWLAFLRQAGIVQWGSPLPRTSNPTDAADPNDLIWFYPGHWFGVDEPLATIQLKWLRRAQQDYEYLWLARQRGTLLNAMVMARLITKPVEVQPGQRSDPVYALMTGTADPAAWAEGQQLLSKVVLLREPGADADPAKESELNVQVLRWTRPQERALLMNRSAVWGFAPGSDRIINLTLGIDIYNASDTKPDQNRLQWTNIPKGFQAQWAPQTLPALSTYRVERAETQAQFNTDSVDVKDRQPAELTFTNGFLNVDSKLNFVLPVAPTDRLGPGLNANDGKLNDWDIADVIQSGPMVRMFDRPALQKQELQWSDAPATLYTGWADANFYVAFRVSAPSSSNAETRNFVDYQFRRAWGEDLCEILIQPIFADNSVGPVLHVVCKPAGQWVERKLDARRFTDPWQPLEGAGIKYSARNEGAWTGEVAIPWKAITDREKGLPKLLRFNFVQHVHSTGQSASWAGPVDFGRDDAFMGLLVVRESAEPGIANTP